MLWAVLPYAAMLTFGIGLAWRYRHDKFGWTTRSSQLHDSALLRWGSPMFHFGLLVVLAGHAAGLLVPKTWTEAMGISENTYHLLAAVIGTISGVCTVAGLAILLGRRVRIPPVRRATTRNDIVLFVALAATIAFGLLATVGAASVDGYDYRDTVSPWLRSLFALDPRVELMADVPLAFQTHVLLAFALFAIWPFTRLVHALSAPIGYLTRPYIVYRHRDKESARP
jgi:nitrate reductase gamma subunit